MSEQSFEGIHPTCILPSSMNNFNWAKRLDWFGSIIC